MMGGEAPLSSKLYVVLSSNILTQQELEKTLLAGRYSIVSSEYASIYIEELDPSKDMEGHSGLIIPSGFMGRDIKTLATTLGIRDSLKNSTMQILKAGTADGGPIVSPSHSESNYRDDTWLLSQDRKELGKYDTIIPLTSIELSLIDKLMRASARLVSKDDLIISIGRQPEHYQGLEMCLSRLQSKFKRVSGGEKLIKAVRNQGYCLVQSVSWAH